MMDCDRIEELLPWLLNGTLEAGERAQVLEHLRSCARCRQALADTRTAWEIYAWHPPAEALIAYAAGSAGSASGIEEHLAECPRCATELELVRTSRLLTQDGEEGEDGGARIAIFRPPASPALPAPSAHQPAAASTPASGPPAAFPGGRRHPVATPGGRAWRRAALAAGLVGLVALSGWFESTRHARILGEHLAALEGGASLRGAQVDRQGSAAATHGASGAAGGLGAPGMAADQLRRQAADAAARVAALERENGEARARLAALAEQSRQMEQRLARLGPPGAAAGAGGEAGEEAGGPGQRQARLAAAAPIPAIESDISVTEVSPAEETTRSGEAAAPEAIPLSDGAATLVLKGRSITSYAAYEVEVQDAHGHRAGEATPVPRPRHGAGEELDEFYITLRRDAFAPGSYVIHLFGRTAAGRKQLATYPLRIT